MTNNLELNSEICNNLIDMSQSTDMSNKVLVSEIIKYCDIELNLPYLLVMFKFLPVSTRDEVFTKEILSKINIITNNQLDKNISFNTMYEIIKNKKCSDESFNFFMFKFCEALENNLTSWGFSFIKDYKLNLSKR